MQTFSYPKQELLAKYTTLPLDAECIIVLLLRSFLLSLFLMGSCAESSSCGGDRQFDAAATVPLVSYNGLNFYAGYLMHYTINLDKLEIYN